MRIFGSKRPLDDLLYSDLIIKDVFVPDQKKSGRYKKEPFCVKNKYLDQ